MTVMIQRGETLPDFTLPDASGKMVSSRASYMRQNMIVATLPETLGSQGVMWLDQLLAAMELVPDRDAFCFVLLSSKWEDVARERATNLKNVGLLIDRDGRVLERLGCDPQVARLLIADRYGVVFHSVSGNYDAPDLDPSGIPEWVEFIACRCS